MSDDFTQKLRDIQAKSKAQQNKSIIDEPPANEWFQIPNVPGIPGMQAMKEMVQNNPQLAGCLTEATPSTQRGMAQYQQMQHMAQSLPGNTGKSLMPTSPGELAQVMPNTDCSLGPKEPLTPLPQIMASLPLTGMTPTAEMIREMEQQRWLREKGLDVVCHVTFIDEKGYPKGADITLFYNETLLYNKQFILECMLRGNVEMFDFEFFRDELWPYPFDLDEKMCDVYPDRLVFMRQVTDPDDIDTEESESSSSE
jgi:hypothetical protein